LNAFAIQSSICEIQQMRSWGLPRISCGVWWLWRTSCGFPQRKPRTQPRPVQRTGNPGRSRRFRPRYAPTASRGRLANLGLPSFPFGPCYDADSGGTFFPHASAEVQETRTSGPKGHRTWRVDVRAEARTYLAASFSTALKPDLPCSEFSAAVKPGPTQQRLFHSL
jgi:hypothetical protein